MYFAFTTIFVTIASTLQAHAYLSVPSNALDVRHYHLVQRNEDGHIVARAFMNTYDFAERDEADSGPTLWRRGSCQTINACGTAAGCAIMAPMRMCKDKSAKETLNEAAKQSGANGAQALKMIGDSAARGPAGTVAGLASTTAKAIKDVQKKDDKAKGKKKKRGLDLVYRDEESMIFDKRDYEFVERDEDFNLLGRGEYSTYQLVTRDEDDSIVMRACQVFNGDVSCE